MKILLLLIFFAQAIYSAGFTSNTVLLTNQGQIIIDTIDQETLIACTKNYFQKIVDTQKCYSENIVQLLVVDEIITCHPEQPFWCVNQNNWINAEDLTANDLLLTINHECIAIDSVQIVHQETALYSLTVEPPHHLFIGKNSILAHNLAPAVIVLNLPCATQFLSKAAYTVFVFLGGCIANYFAKNNNKKKAKCATSVQPTGNGPAFFNPNDKNKHPHGIYEDADYHGKNQNGRKSPRPKNGQKALDNSISVEGELSRRVSVCDGEIVVLNPTTPNHYHGYVTTFKELQAGSDAYQSIINTLRNAKLITFAGKIIK